MARPDIAGLLQAQLLETGRANVGLLRLRIEDIPDVVAEHTALEDETLERGGDVVEHRRTEEPVVPGHPGELVGLVAGQAAEVLGESVVAGAEEVNGERGSPAWRRARCG